MCGAFAIETPVQGVQTEVTGMRITGKSPWEYIDPIITEMMKERDRFVREPDRDFTRKRILTFSKCISTQLKMESRTLNSELIHIFKNDKQNPSASAYVQAMEKIRPEAMPYLFRRVREEMIIAGSEYRGYRLIAADGSDIYYKYNPEAEGCAFEENGKRYNLAHVNALLDVGDGRFLDTIIQERRKENEVEAVIEMLERNQWKSKTVFIADRGYEAYKLFACIQQKGMKYVIRIKEPDKHGIINRYKLPKSGEFDEAIELILKRKGSVKGERVAEQIKYVEDQSRYGYCSEEEPEYKLRSRIVSIKLERGRYEYLITNLERERFGYDELREIYRRRWEIETAFRGLKYAVGMRAFHTRKQNRIEQEVYAALIVYNLAIAFRARAQQIAGKSAGKEAEVYQIRFSESVTYTRLLLEGTTTQKKAQENIQRYKIKERRGRAEPRKNSHPKQSNFCYRPA